MYSSTKPQLTSWKFLILRFKVLLPILNETSCGKYPMAFESETFQILLYSQILSSVKHVSFETCIVNAFSRNTTSDNSKASRRAKTFPISFSVSPCWQIKLPHHPFLASTLSSAFCHRYNHSPHSLLNSFALSAPSYLPWKLSKLFHTLLSLSTWFNRINS